MMNLILYNISKPKNIKSLLLAAGAFGCSTVFVVGMRKFNFGYEGDDGNSNNNSNENSTHHNACSRTQYDVPRQLHPLLRSGRLKIKIFENINQCVSHLRKINVHILGVEILEDAKDVEEDDNPFPSDGEVALMMGNEGSGMSEKQMEICDSFVRITQYGVGTASLNVNVAANIILHRHQMWAAQK